MSEPACVLNVAATVQYNSVADFVDEVRVVPPVSRWTRNSVIGTPISGSCGPGSGSASITPTYDSQGRLAVVVAVGQVTPPLVTVGTSTTTYSAWDSFGRPTAGTVIVRSSRPSPVSFTGTVSVSYDNAARTTRTTTLISGQQTVSTITYDANGNIVSTVGPEGLTTSTTTSTARICR